MRRYTDFTRELDIEKATTTTSYKVGAVTFTREAFASLSDGVIVMCLKASKRGQLSFIANLSTLQPRAEIKTNTSDLLLSWNDNGSRRSSRAK